MFSAKALHVFDKSSAAARIHPLSTTDHRGCKKRKPPTYPDERPLYSDKHCLLVTDFLRTALLLNHERKEDYSRIRLRRHTDPGRFFPASISDGKLEICFYLLIGDISYWENRLIRIVWSAFCSLWPGSALWHEAEKCVGQLYGSRQEIELDNRQKETPLHRFQRCAREFSVSLSGTLERNRRWIST